MSKNTTDSIKMPKSTTTPKSEHGRPDLRDLAVAGGSPTLDASNDLPSGFDSMSSRDQHAAVLARQDDELASLDSVLGNLKPIAIGIRDEIGVQNELLENLADSVDEVEGRTAGERSRLKLLMKKSTSTCCLWMTILILTVILILLIVIK